MGDIPQSINSGHSLKDLLFGDFEEVRCSQDPSKLTLQPKQPRLIDEKRHRNKEHLLECSDLSDDDSPCESIGLRDNYRTLPVNKKKSVKHVTKISRRKKTGYWKKE